MRRLWLYPAIVLLGALASCSSPPKYRLPVAEIEARATEIIAVLKTGDTNQDGVIEQAEWYALMANVTNYLLNLAIQLSQPKPTP